MMRRLQLLPLNQTTVAYCIDRTDYGVLSGEGGNLILRRLLVRGIATFLFYAHPCNLPL